MVFDVGLTSTPLTSASFAWSRLSIRTHFVRLQAVERVARAPMRHLAYRRNDWNATAWLLKTLTAVIGCGSISAVRWLAAILTWPCRLAVTLSEAEGSLRGTARRHLAAEAAAACLLELIFSAMTNPVVPSTFYSTCSLMAIELYATSPAIIYAAWRISLTSKFFRTLAGCFWIRRIAFRDVCSSWPLRRESGRLPISALRSQFRYSSGFRSGL